MENISRFSHEQTWQSRAKHEFRAGYSHSLLNPNTTNWITKVGMVGVGILGAVVFSTAIERLYMSANRDEILNCLKKYESWQNEHGRAISSEKNYYLSQCAGIDIKFLNSMIETYAVDRLPDPSFHRSAADVDQLTSLFTIASNIGTCVIAALVPAGLAAGAERRWGKSSAMLVQLAALPLLLSYKNDSLHRYMASSLSMLATASVTSLDLGSARSICGNIAGIMPNLYAAGRLKGSVATIVITAMMVHSPGWRSSLDGIGINMRSARDVAVEAAGVFATCSLSYAMGQNPLYGLAPFCVRLGLLPVCYTVSKHITSLFSPTTLAKVHGAKCYAESVASSSWTQLKAVNARAHVTFSA